MKLDTIYINYRNKAPDYRHPTFEGTYYEEVAQRTDACARRPLNGSGLFISRDGVIFEGVFEEGALLHGRVTFLDGRVYQGDLWRWRPDGKGVYRSADGSVYTGQCRWGTPHGSGTFATSDGRMYAGPFLNGTLNGKVLVRLPNGRSVYQQFIHGQHHPEISLNTTIVTRRCVHFPNGIRYEGDLVEGKPYGEGTFTFANGGTYTGQVCDGKMHGTGTYTGCTQRLAKDSIFYNHQFELFSKPQLQKELGNPLFLEILCGTFEGGMLSSYPLAIMASFLKHYRGLTDPENPLLLALHVLQGRIPAVTIMERLNNGISSLLCCESQEHVMGLQLTSSFRHIIDIHLFNAGDGLEYHPHSEEVEYDEKYQTHLVIQVPFHEFTQNTLTDLLNIYPHKTTEECYEYLLNLPGAQTINPPNELSVMQTEQKGDTCSLGWINAFLRNYLTDGSYIHLRTDLFTMCLTQCQHLLNEMQDSGFMTQQEQRLATALRELIPTLEYKINGRIGKVQKARALRGDTPDWGQINPAVKQQYERRLDWEIREHTGLLDSQDSQASPPLDTVWAEWQIKRDNYLKEFHQTVTAPTLAQLRGLEEDFENQWHSRRPSREVYQNIREQAVQLKDLFSAKFLCDAVKFSSLFEDCSRPPLPTDIGMIERELEEIRKKASNTIKKFDLVISRWDSLMAAH